MVNFHRLPPISQSPLGLDELGKPWLFRSSLPEYLRGGFLSTLFCHNNLEQLQKYLEVKPEQVRGAVAALSMLSHVGESGGEGYVGKLIYDDLSPNP